MINYDRMYHMNKRSKEICEKPVTKPNKIMNKFVVPKENNSAKLKNLEEALNERLRED